MSNRRPFRLIVRIVLLLIVLPTPLSWAGDVELCLSGDRLTLRADGIPLQTILRTFSDTGIHVHIDPRINPTITVSIDDEEIQKGLASLLKSLNYSLVWTSREGPSGSVQTLVEIRIFRPGEWASMRPLVTQRNLVLVSNQLDGTSFVKNEILIELREGMDPQRFEAFLRRIGGSVVGYHAATKVYRIVLGKDTNIPSLVERLADYPGIATAEPNFVYPIYAPVKRDSSSVPSSGATTRVVSKDVAPIAILDSGLSRTAGLDELIVTGLNARNPDEPLTDSLGHGTQMALIAAGVVTPRGVKRESNTAVPIIPIRIFDDNGYTSNYDLMKSVDFAVANGARVMSLSWGSETHSTFLKKTLDYADSKDLIIIASAGNEPTGRPMYPAAYASVIGVGALTPDGNTWNRSNYGDFVTVYAPGFATLPVGYKGDPGDYAGTSIATAFLAHVIAEYISKNPEASKEEILAALKTQ